MTDFKGVTVCKTKEDYDGIANKDPDRLYVVENEDLVKLYHNLGQHTDGAVDQKTVTDSLNANQAVFIALYGVTSYDDVKDALDEGKIVIAKDTYRQYITSFITDEVITFASPYVNSHFAVRLDHNDNWTRTTDSMELASYRVTSISSESDDYHYPSAKCVYDALNETLMRAYPVGSVYINASNSTNPSTLLGFGTWVSLGAGRCLMGVDTGQTEFNSVGKTGGEKTHTLTTDEMPSHNHVVNITTTSNGASSGTIKPLVIDNGGGSDTWHTATGNCSVPGGRQNGACSTGSNNHWIDLHINVPNHTHSVMGSTNSSGGNGAHNNLAPYITVYMWKRTA